VENLPENLDTEMGGGTSARGEEGESGQSPGDEDFRTKSGRQEKRDCGQRRGGGSEIRAPW
jgi:hypothetical protein